MVHIYIYGIDIYTIILIWVRELNPKPFDTVSLGLTGSKQTTLTDRYIYHHSYMGEVAGWDGMVLIKQKNLGNDKYICIYMFLKISLIYIYILNGPIHSTVLPILLNYFRFIFLLLLEGIIIIIIIIIILIYHILLSF